MKIKWRIFKKKKKSKTSEHENSENKYLGYFVNLKYNFKVYLVFLWLNKFFLNKINNFPY